MQLGTWCIDFKVWEQNLRFLNVLIFMVEFLGSSCVYSFTTCGTEIHTYVTWENVHIIWKTYTRYPWTQTCSMQTIAITCWFYFCFSQFKGITYKSNKLGKNQIKVFKWLVLYIFTLQFDSILQHSSLKFQN